MRRRERLFRDAEKIFKTVIVKMCDVYQDPFLFHLGNDFAAEIRKAVICRMAGSDLIFAVPDQGHAADTVCPKLRDT